MSFPCLKCNRFCSNIRYIENGNHDIKRVFGDCKKCGKDVDVHWYDYEQIHPQSEEECDLEKQKNYDIAKMERGQKTV